MPQTYDEETRKLLETRKRRAEIKRAQQIKKRNTMIAAIGAIVLVLLLIIIISVSCSSGKKEAKQPVSEVQTTSAAVIETTTPVPETTTFASMYTTDTLNLRKGPSTKTDIITQIDIGKRVDVLSEEGKWCKVQRGKDIGYVMKEFLSYEKTVD